MNTPAPADHPATVPGILVPDAPANLIRVVPASVIIDRWKNELAIDVTAEFHGLTDVLCYQCSQTGLQFFRPAILTGSMAIYAGLQKFDWYYETEKWEHDRSLRDLSGYNRVAEIGCGTGLFVKKARAAGFDITGYELSRAAVDAARASDLPVEYGDLADLAATRAGEFDAACCFQVLEHVPDPRAFIRDMVGLVRPGGVVIFSVPNDDSYLKTSDDLLNYPPHHMSRWSEKSLGSFASFAPVELVALRREKLSRGSIPYFINGKVRSFPGGDWRRRLLLNRVTIPVLSASLRFGLRSFFTGHTMYAVYRKTTK